MIKLLVIARYHNTTMGRKLELLEEQADFKVWLIHPRTWQNELGRTEVNLADLHVMRLPISMCGRPSDPHRALYQSFTFSMRSIRPDIIHAEEEPDSLTALQITLAHRLFAPSAKLVLNSWQNVNRPKAWYVRLLMMLTLSSCDAITCANHEAIEVLRRNGYRRVANLLPPIGVDARVFHPDPWVKHNEFTVGYVGRLVPEKKVSELVEAMRLLVQEGTPTNVRLLILGDGPERLSLHKQVFEAGLQDKVAFTQPRSPDGVATVMRQLDVLVLPSCTTSTWKEQFGRVLVEAMASRVAVVGSDSGAIPEVVGDTGLIFREGDVAMLKEKLYRLINSPDLRRQLAMAGYERVMNLYTQERIAEKSAEFYRQLVP